MTQQQRQVTYRQKIEQLKQAQIVQISLSILSEIQEILQSISLQSISNLDSFLDQMLNPTVKQIININIDKIEQSRQLLQSILQKIISIYCQILERFCIKGIFSTIKKTLQSNAMIFTSEIPNRYQNDPIKIARSRYHQNNNKFFYKCCEILQKSLLSICRSFSKGSIGFVTEYFDFLSYIDQFLKEQQKLEVISTALDSLENIVKDIGEYQQFSKSITVPHMQNLMKCLQKISKNYLREQIQERGDMISIECFSSMLHSSNTIQKRMNTLQMLNQLTKSIKQQKQANFCLKLVDKNIFEYIIEHGQNASIIKSSNDLLRMFIKNKCVNLQQFSKMFDFIFIKSGVEVRQIVYKLIFNFYEKLSDDHYTYIIEKFRGGQHPELFNLQLFNLLEKFTPQSYETAKKAVGIFQEILEANWQKYNNNKIQGKLLAVFVRMVAKMIEKNINTVDKVDQFMELFDHYLGDISKFGMDIIQNILTQIISSLREMLSQKIISEKGFLERALVQLEGEFASKICLQRFVCFILGNLSRSKTNSIKFDQQTLLKTAIYPNIFDCILSLLHNQQENERLFEEVVARFFPDKIPFICIRSFFYHINMQSVRKIDLLYAETQYVLLKPASELKGLPIFFQLLRESQEKDTRNQISCLIAEIYTLYERNKVSEGNQQLIYFMNAVIESTLNAFREQKISELLGCLSLIQSLMMATQTLGVGSLPPHISFVFSHMTSVKIYNQFEDSSSYPAVFQLTMPSNSIVFDLICEISKIFKCSVDDIMLTLQGSLFSDTNNGLTLQQAQIDGKQLSVVRTFRQRIHKQPLIINSQLSPKAKQVIEQIYNFFAVNGKMGKNQCANYIEGVTRFKTLPTDFKVRNMIAQWGDDQDQNITVHSFLKFYQESCILGKQEIVWGNIIAMKYRRDLTRQSEPIRPSNKYMFRYYLYQNENIYQLLFSLISVEYGELSEGVKRILVRLPTCPYIFKQFDEDLNLLQKSAFETQYTLVTMLKKLKDCSVQEKKVLITQLIQSDNAIKLFNMITRVLSNAQISELQKQCLRLCLTLLRNTLDVPHLQQHISPDLTNINLIQLPQNKQFLKLIKSSIDFGDLEILESSLALQLTQQNPQVQGIIENVCHSQIQIRKMVCNFLLMLQILGKMNYNIFQIQNKVHCEQWFDLLQKIIHINHVIQYRTVFQKSLASLEECSHDIDFNRRDKVIEGNLKIINSIIMKNRYRLDQKSVGILMDLLTCTVSEGTRISLYKILGFQDCDWTFQYLRTLLNSVTYHKSVPKKQYFMGMKNLGCTCYMSSILQIFYHIKEFRYLIFSIDDQRHLLKTQIDGYEFYDDKLYQLRKMYAYLSLSQRSSYNPKQFFLTFKDPITNKPINLSIQEDAHEFIGNFIDFLESYIENYPLIDNFKSIFYFKTITEYTCQQCYNEILREESYCQLPIQVKDHTDIISSLQKYVEPETILDYFCEKCQKKVEKFNKSTHLLSLPEILTFNLQRINFDLETGKNLKIDSFFEFPFDKLNIQEYVSKRASKINMSDCEYELKAVVIHSGTAQSGHYYSIIKAQSQWYKFNDKIVTKFDINDLSKQAYGGFSTNEQWNDSSKFSTNAYILFYEKCNRKAKEIMEIEIDPKFINEIKTDNQKFFHELQVHQQSIINFVIYYYQIIRPENINIMMKLYNFYEEWSEDLYLHQYELLIDMMHSLLIFLHTYNDVSTQLIRKFITYLTQLHFLLPERSVLFILNWNPETVIEGLCLHNDQRIRNVYGPLILKSLQICAEFYNFIQPSTQQENQLKSFIDHLFNYIHDPRLFKNIYKSYCYFETLKFCVEGIPQIYNYFQSKQIIVFLVDILMDNESPLANNEVKRQEAPFEHAYLIIELLLSFMQSKRNLMDYINQRYVQQGIFYTNLTEQQAKMISNIGFYKKMIKNMLDSNFLANLTVRLAEQDEQFSKKMVGLFLNTLNSNDQRYSSILIINHIRGFLLIDDDFTLKRIKWILGIPQLEVGEKLNYGLKYSDRSPVYSYVSPLHFIHNGEYNPALEVLFLKRSDYNQLSISGMKLLLQLICQSPIVFEYVMNLPAPIYIYRSYLDLVWQFIEGLKDADVRTTQINKQHEYHHLSQLMNQIEQKVREVKVNLPANKHIIGINKKCIQLPTHRCSDYQLNLWAHETYTLDNQPTGTYNKSLPSSQFRNGYPDSILKYFVCFFYDREPVQNNQVNAKRTVYSLEIDTKKKLVLTFDFQNFKEEIHFEKGKGIINFPYSPLKYELQHYLEVLTLEIDDIEARNMEVQNMTNTNKQQYVLNKTTCSVCTFINYGMQQCQMCQTRL